MCCNLVFGIQKLFKFIKCNKKNKHREIKRREHGGTQRGKWLKAISVLCVLGFIHMGLKFFFSDMILGLRDIFNFAGFA
jgi:hypothetical protein